MVMPLPARCSGCGERVYLLFNPVAGFSPIGRNAGEPLRRQFPEWCEENGDHHLCLNPERTCGTVLATKGPAQFEAARATDGTSAKGPAMPDTTTPSVEAAT